MKVEIAIERITVSTGEGQDRVSLWTILPDPTSVNDKLTLDFKTPRGKGEEFVRKYFKGIPVTVSKQPEHKYKFSENSDE